MAPIIFSNNFTKPQFYDPVVYDAEDPYPSLSGYHDYEPQLEFDDAELLERKPEEEDDFDEEIPATAVAPVVGNGGGIDSPMSDGTIDEDFSLQLAREVEIAGQIGSPMTPCVDTKQETEADFADIAEHGIVEVCGDDNQGRKIIVVSACKLPPNKNFDNRRFLRYLILTLEKYVTMDYTLVYFHHGLTSSNKPPLAWLWGLYKVLDRNFKKNLKSLLIVHPTTFIGVVFNFFKPIISYKFGRKIQRIKSLSELSQFMDISMLPIPKEVKDYDRRYSKMSSGQSRTDLNLSSWHPSQQFGVTLEWILDNQSCTIPPVMEACINFLQQPDCLETEGIFRRCGSAATVKEYIQKVNRGEKVEFSVQRDVHIVTVLLKTFLRELSHPILTYQLFDSILHFADIPKDSRLDYCKNLIIKKLPDQNYVVLKYLMEFLCLVNDRSDMNKMTSSNLSLVFGPNLAWSNDKQNIKLGLTSIGPINTFTQYLIDNTYDVFII